MVVIITDYCYGLPGISILACVKRKSFKDIFFLFRASLRNDQEIPNYMLYSIYIYIYMKAATDERQ